MTWREHAPCLGATHMFFEDVYGPEGDAFDTDAHVVAVEICGGCPVLRECAMNVLAEEEDMPPEDRFGVAAGMTPAQRFSLQERGTLRHSCGHVRDPLDLIEGIHLCPNCKIDRQVPPIPLDGDRWRKRHSTLARKVVARMVGEVPLGGEMPPPTRLAVDMQVRVQDMVRVYEALSADGTLDPGNGRKPKYRRAKISGVVREWTPVHLRCME